MNVKDRKKKQEKELIEKMISIYCKGHHEINLCDDCKELMNYANQRIELCPLIESKTFCSQCKVHCYDHNHRDRVKQVMKYSGKRMTWVNPIVVFRHLTDSLKNKRRAT